MAYKGNMKRRLAKADSQGARFALILGDDEIANGVVAVKDLVTGQQESVSLADVCDDLLGRLAGVNRGPDGRVGWTLYAPEGVLRGA